MILPNAAFEQSGNAAAAVPDLVAAIFRPGGWLETALALEHRPQQEQMAREVANAFRSDLPLLFEAGTGTGKSLAYLIPGILFSVTQNRPFVVCAHTIALQEQLLKKDLGICRDLFQVVPELHAFSGFRSALLLGRGNYVCAKRLKRSTHEQSELFSNPVGTQLAALEEWISSTTDGLRQELTFAPDQELWEAVSADATACNRKECPARECFYHRARTRVEQSHVIILNHSLLFSLLNAGMSPGGDKPGILLPHDRVVLDEAHTVPSIATNHLGSSLSSYGMRRLLHRLYEPKERKGFLRTHGDNPARDAVGAAIEASEEFFALLEHTWLRNREIIRIAETHWVETPLPELLGTVAGHLKRLASRVPDDDLLDEFSDLVTRTATTASKLRDLMAAEDEKLVYWLERTGRRGTTIHLNTAPLDVAPLLRELLFTRDAGLLLTSATLDSGDNLAGFKARTGAGACRHTVVSSPFDFEIQARSLVAMDAPEPGPPSSGDDAYLGYWSEAIATLTASCSGGTLALFTSFRDLTRVQQACERDPRLRERTLLFQRAGSNRTLLLEEFRRLGNALLLGTESFWTGIDVPGPALSQVIVTRLPFENPSHPVAQARGEYLRERGENPFAAMTLPEAVLKFRQGVGRLIRGSRDEGRIVILDSRVLRKPYGARFLQTLPTSRYERFTLSTLQELLRRFP